MRINTYSDWTDGAVRRFMRDAGPQLDDLFALSRADITSHRFERVRAVLATVDALAGALPAAGSAGRDRQDAQPARRRGVDGADRRPPGRWIARVKDFLLDLVLDGELDMDDTGARRGAGARLPGDPLRLAGGRTHMSATELMPTLELLAQGAGAGNRARLSEPFDQRRRHPGVLPRASTSMTMMRHRGRRGEHSGLSGALRSRSHRRGAGTPGTGDAAQLDATDRALR